MSSASNPEMSSPRPDAADRRAARLAEIKQLADSAARTHEAGALNDEELYDAAACGLRARREERGDLVGALIWERIARHEQQTHSSRADAGSPRPGHNQIVPAYRAIPDRHDGV